MKHFKSFYNMMIKRQDVVFFTFLFMLILPNIVMFFTESTSTLTRFCNILLPFGAYWLCLTFNKKPGIMFWILFFFIFLDAFEIVLLYLFGESPIAVDMFLNVLTTNVTEVNELLSDLIPAVAIVFIIYVYGIVLSVYSIRNKESLSRLFLVNQRKYATIFLVPAILLTGANYFVDDYFKMRNDIFPVNACYNLGLAVRSAVKANKYETTSKNFSFHAESKHNDTIPEIYVFVIGESSRADNYGIYGYDRNTTPNLSKISDLVVYRDAITMSNTTHKSVPMLMSAIASENYDSLYYQKGIITAFDEAGYQTAFYSNQRRNHSFIDFMGSEADEEKFIRDDYGVNEIVSDDRLLELFDKKIESFKSGKLFVVLHCYGSHFSYYDRYQRKDAYFKPDYIKSADKKFRNEIVNAYDNSIRITDVFLSHVIGTLSRCNVASALVYTSDHGEDIFDDKRGHFLHASPIASYYQLRVPFLVWASSEYKTNFPSKWQNIEANKDKPISSNLVTFHTLLDISGISSPYLKKTNALSCPDFKSGVRYYVNDHNEFVPLNRSGLKKLDEEAFKKHGLQYP